jgi:hypothetical protein
MINFKFILVATLSYIPITVMWFFWHNNLFPNVYYFSNPHETLQFVQGLGTQNIWAMNFANALLLYGMVYFFFKGIKPETTIIKPVFWGIYYNLSVFGFFNFMAIGFFNGWTWECLVYDLIFAVISGAISGALIFKLYRWVYR